MANGDSIRAPGIVHLSIEMRFIHFIHVCMLLIFVCDLSSNIDCIFDLDAAREIGFILHFGTGVLWHDDTNRTPVNDVCLENRRKLVYSMLVL